MEKISAKGGMYVLLPVVLLSLSSMVGANDITFFASTSECSGPGIVFANAAAELCCISNMDSCKTSRVYANGGCDGAEVSSGTGNTCYVSAGLNAAKWSQSCRRRSLLGEAESDLTKCRGQAQPTGVVFTEDSTKGSWILKTSDAHNLFSQLESLPEGEKVNWLQSQGASFSA